MVGYHDYIVVMHKVSMLVRVLWMHDIINDSIIIEALLPSRRVYVSQCLILVQNDPECFHKFT